MAKQVPDPKDSGRRQVRGIKQNQGNDPIGNIQPVVDMELIKIQTMDKLTKLN